MSLSIFGDIISLLVVFAVPLLLVALGGMFSERSGVINIALDGIMIIGALFGCLTLSGFDKSGFGPEHPMLAMGIAIIVSAVTGAVYSLLLAFASVTLNADQTIGGTALNTLAPAFAIVLTWAIQGQGQTTILIPNWVRITGENFGIQPRDSVLYNIFFKYCYLTTPLAIVILIVTTIVLYKTRFGLRLRSCGEHPQASASVGIDVYKMRYTGVFISGLLGGLGGLAYTVAAGAGFQSTVMGYGFLALAVMIFGNWKPLNILGASLFFALFKVIGNYSGSISWLPDFANINNSDYIYQMLPYVATMVLLILTSKKSAAPKAEGIPYDKGSR